MGQTCSSLSGVFLTRSLFFRTHPCGSVNDLLGVIGDEYTKVYSYSEDRRFRTHSFQADGDTFSSHKLLDWLLLCLNTRTNDSHHDEPPLYLNAAPRCSPSSCLRSIENGREANHGIGCRHRNGWPFEQVCRASTSSCNASAKKQNGRCYD